MYANFDKQKKANHFFPRVFIITLSNVEQNKKNIVQDILWKRNKNKTKTRKLLIQKRPTNEEHENRDNIYLIPHGLGETSIGYGERTSTFWKTLSTIFFKKMNSSISIIENF